MGAIFKNGTKRRQFDTQLLNLKHKSSSKNRNLTNHTNA